MITTQGTYPGLSEKFSHGLLVGGLAGGAIILAVYIPDEDDFLCKCACSHRSVVLSFEVPPFLWGVLSSIGVYDMVLPLP